MTTTPSHSHSKVLILQHTLEDGPAYLRTWLEQQNIRYDLYCSEAGDAYPSSVASYAGLAVLGGSWSALDTRPSLAHALALIQEADRLRIPVIGHCLGGQLLALALGGQVARLPQPEIGWTALRFLASTASHRKTHDWFGAVTAQSQAIVYQWHYDSFVQLPAAATLLASSAQCRHQAFAVGPHLGMQFHIEIDSPKLQQWCSTPDDDYAQALQQASPSVQTPAAMLTQARHYLHDSQQLASAIYAAWRQRFVPSAS